MGKRVAVLVGLVLALVLVVGCSSPAETPSRAEFQQYLMASAEVEGGRVAFADLAVEAGCPGPVIYDLTGQVQDLSWLESTFGAVGWECAEAHPAAGYVFRLTALRESCGPAVIIVNVTDENGYALEGRAVVRYWPGAPALPVYDPPASRWTDLGVVGWTSGSGDVGFGLGAGDYYFPETGTGVTQIYVADYDGPSDLVKNLGMLGGTEHCTLFPVFSRIPVEDVDPETPTPSPLTPSPYPLPEGEGFFRIEGMWIQLGTPEP